MNKDRKYGEVKTEFGNFIDGEPLFVCRARDVLLPDVLSAYSKLCVSLGSPQKHIALIDQLRQEILDWQEENRSMVLPPKSESYFDRISPSETK